MSKNYLDVAKEESKVKKKVFTIGKLDLAIHGNSAKLLHDLEHSRLEVGKLFIKEKVIDERTNKEEVEKLMIEYILGDKDIKIRDKVLAIIFNSLFDTKDIKKRNKLGIKQTIKVPKDNKISTIAQIRLELKSNGIEKEIADKTIIFLINDIIEWIGTLNKVVGETAEKK